ncbi:MAG: hypothetical protein P9X27_04730 [Candidatus Kaelpia aquatica]|nr:hypothetical protein [Candidatus Kaelpia aquatica]
MDFEQKWNRAVKNTEIEKSWAGYLNTSSSTVLSYIMLSESMLDSSDTVVRKGRVEVTRPLIYLPDNNPVFKGFELSEHNLFDNSAITFLLLRGVSFPSLKYQNSVYSLDIDNLSLNEVVKKHKRELQRLEDVKTGLIVGPDDYWHYSLAIYVAALASKSASNDIERYLEDLKGKFRDR